MYTYTLFININENDNVYLEHEWEYRHKSVSNPLKISMSDQKIKIFMSLTKKYDTFLDIVEKSRAFGLAIEKSLIIYIILYSEMISINNTSCIRVTENKKKAKFCLPIKESISSLISGNLEHKFPDEWRNDNEWIEHFINDADEDNPLSALYSLVISKNKKYEIERFQYLWISMNGMYGHFHKIIKDIAKNENIERLRKKKLKNYQECLQISDFCILNRWLDDDARNLNWKKSKRDDETIEKKEASRVRKRIYPILLNLIRETGKLDIELLNIEGVEETLKKELYTDRTSHDTELGYQAVFPISVRGYLTIRLPYQYRCEYFHANEPIPIFNIGNIFSPSNNKIFKLMNNIMENYIENELFKWFTDEKRRELEDSARDILKRYGDGGGQEAQPAAQSNATNN